MIIRKRTYIALTLLAALALPMGAHASAQHTVPDWRKTKAVQTMNGMVSSQMQYVQNRERKISSSRAKSIAMSRHPGAEYVNVQMVRGDTYRVRLKKNGRIIDVYVDAYTGRVKN